MNNLDDLKDAMHSPPDFAPSPIDLGAVMAAGGRLRRRRRVAVGASSAAAVLVLLVGGSQLTRLGGGGSGPDRPATAVAARPSGPVSSAPSGDVLGEVITTDLATPGDDRIAFWFVPIDDDALPRTTFGLMAGRRTTDDKLKPEVVTNETEGSDRDPGFHAPEAAMEVDGFRSPAFGYYVGEHVARITVVADGRRVDADLAPWSRDPSVVVFWFDPAEVKPDARLTKLTAYDADGKALPGAGAEFGVG
ncbi:hypothetical protein AB0J80_04440 [Actinoplanes sp. NPDC049548]|uniref:hypothetical protein n=1 Tax=Actinoplanes sp. NPDC049548 TaxID=3155152 RepID=UPI0034347031